jgi:hypothetical protein
MATVGNENKKKPAEPVEEPVDYLRDAPPARPYSDAVSDEHRKALAEVGIIVPERSTK